MVVLTFDFARHRPSASFRDCLPRRPPLLREPIPRMLLPRFVAYRRVAPTLARRDRGCRLAPLEGHVGLVYDGRVGEAGRLERRTGPRGFTIGLMTASGCFGLYISFSPSSGLSISMLQCSPPTRSLPCYIIIDASLLEYTHCTFLPLPSHHTVKHSYGQRNFPDALFRFTRAQHDFNVTSSLPVVVLWCRRWLD